MYPLKNYYALPRIHKCQFQYYGIDSAVLWDELAQWVQSSSERWSLPHETWTQSRLNDYTKLNTKLNQEK